LSKNLSKGRREGLMRCRMGNFECLEAHFSGAAFGRHRHDTYTIAVTIHGVQQFRYRGASLQSKPGQVIVLHPDEPHDGQAGTDAGFGYRSVNIAPQEMQRVIGGQVLPFVNPAVVQSPRLRTAVKKMTSVFDTSLDAPEYDDALFELACELDRLAGSRQRSRPIDTTSVARAREFIEDRLFDGFDMVSLERATGRNRWQLFRDFRALLGTSPYRYLILRRLDQARLLLLSGRGLAETAQDCSFADQSHFGRRFKQAYGISPGQWLSFQSTGAG